MMYILHHFKQSGLLGDCHLHGVDSTELANYCKIPLASIGIKGKNIRIYNDIDCACGERRNKRDKSNYVNGYRLHTLTAINAKTGHSFPLASLLSSTNHHDIHFLPFLVDLAQAMGIDIKLVTADEAYHYKNGSLLKKPLSLLQHRLLSKHRCRKMRPVIEAQYFVMIHSVLQCAAWDLQTKSMNINAVLSLAECLHSATCSQYRNIPVDSGLFQQIPYETEQIKQALDIRKNCERPFNLLKNQTGLEIIRVRSQYATIARCTLGSIAVLLIKMAGTRKKKRLSTSQQLSLFDKKAA